MKKGLLGKLISIKNWRKLFIRLFYDTFGRPPILSRLQPNQFELKLNKIGTYEEYVQYVEQQHHEYTKRRQFEKLSVLNNEEFKLGGKCFVCRANVKFRVTFDYSSVQDNNPTPNWREQIVCPYCRLANRMRAAVHIFYNVLSPTPASSIYMTEQNTTLYKNLKRQYANLQGSEYLGSSTPFGASDSRGIRNEDITSLTFSSKQFDYVLSFDVLEHVPDYSHGLKELLRVLKPGGHLLFSIPFSLNSKMSVTRAEILSNGAISHILPPEYHGDPINSEGCLCFYNFGWDFLYLMRGIGYENVKALFYWNPDYGYIGGGDQVLFIAQKHA